VRATAGLIPDAEAANLSASATAVQAPPGAGTSLKRKIVVALVVTLLLGTLALLAGQDAP
jgi:hypothetical protein